MSSRRQMSGWVQQERFLRLPARRYLELADTVLRSRVSEDGEQKLELNIWGCLLDCRDREMKFEIRQNSQVVVFRVQSQDEYEKWLKALRRASARNIEYFYETGKVIGSGAFGKVYLGRDLETGAQVAIKAIIKGKNKREREYIRREVKIVKSVQHPNIIKTYDVFEDQSKIYLVLEYIGGGELFDRIATERHFSEKRASEFMKAMLEGVAYLHRHNIVHRDIKPENILCSNSGWPLDIKVTDFGLANFAKPNEDSNDPNVLISYVGTKFYAAPEVHQGRSYGPAVDIWSCGVILYISLSGKFPFYGNHEDFLRRVLRGPVFSEKEWSSVSQEAKNVVAAMLTVDPLKRPSAEELLRNPWFNGENPDIQLGDLTHMMSGNRRTLLA